MFLYQKYVGTISREKDQIQYINNAKNTVTCVLKLLKEGNYDMYIDSCGLCEISPGKRGLF